MSRDSFADLASSLGDFATALRDLLNTNEVPAQGSQADQEATGEPYAGEWGTAPSAAVSAAVRMTSWSCADHLTAAATVLRSQGCAAPLYTLVRGATEAAVLGCYLSEPGILPLERVRRNLNCVLDAICQSFNMTRGAETGDASRSAQHRVEAIKRTAAQHGLRFKPQEQFRSAYIGDRPPPVMKLVDEYAFADTQDGARAGAMAHQLLSGVAHAKLHGLANVIITDGQLAPGAPSAGPAPISVTAQKLARQLLVAPASAENLVHHLRWFFAWETEAIEPTINWMDFTWSRIAGIP